MEKPKCFFCDSELIWNSDCNASDLYGDYDDNDTATIEFFTCPKCGRSYEVCDPTEEERRRDYNEYWNE